MSDCSVCIGTDDYAASGFAQTALRTARRKHVCCECRRVIDPGEQYEIIVVGKWEGTIAQFKTCSECREIRNVFTCGKGWTFETLWDDMREIAFPDLTTATDCFQKLSPAGKKFVLARWKDWKGI